MSGASRYRVPRQAVRVEDRVHHSRFIASVGPAPGVAAARAFIDTVRAEFPDATHHCYAFAVGPPGSAHSVASSDDGEPGGTAGRPMLVALTNSGLGDIVAVVTRYFGGVKLGKGGLVRAYSGAVLHALRELPVGEHTVDVTLRVTVAYALSDAVRRAVARDGGAVVEESYAGDVALTLRVPDDRVDAVERAILDATSGAARIER
jgi:uncharacterized YigZ family protein